MAANAKSILFGAFDKYVIRRVMDLTIFRMTDSAFTLNGQVGFMGAMPMGGNLIDAETVVNGVPQGRDNFFEFQPMVNIEQAAYAILFIVLSLW